MAIKKEPTPELAPGWRDDDDDDDDDDGVCHEEESEEEEPRAEDDIVEANSGGRAGPSLVCTFCSATPEKVSHTCVNEVPLHKCLQPRLLERSSGICCLFFRSSGNKYMMKKSKGPLCSEDAASHQYSPTSQCPFLNLGS